MGAKTRQTALILVGIGLLVALFPMSVTAAGQLMTIVDPSTNLGAKVDPGNKLRIGDGSGPLSVDGTVRVGDGTGPLSVDGTVRVGDGAGPLSVDGTVRVTDGSGAMSVDGTVSTRSLDTNGVVYSSPAGGLECGYSGAGVDMGTKDLSRFSRLRLAVQSGPSNQTIIQFRARVGSEVIVVPWAEWTVPAGQYGHTVFQDPPPQSDLIIYFCSQAKIFVYGLR
jgi:hypothetical protein